MSDLVNLSMIEFLRWVSSRQRTYDEAMEAWHSTCPRHTIWEDAFVDGLIQFENGGAPDQCKVILSPRGRAVLAEHLNQKSIRA